MTRRLAFIVVAFILLSIMPSEARRRRVQVPLPRKPAVDVSAYKNVAVIEFEGIDSPYLLNTQVAGYIETSLRREEEFESVRVLPLEVFTQTVEDIGRAEGDESNIEDDTDLWQEVGKRLGYDLIFYGSYRFDAQYQPGYIQEKRIDESSGLTYYQDVYKEMIGYKLTLTFNLIDTTTGEVLNEKEMTSDTTIQGQSAPNSSGFRELMKRLYGPLHRSMFPPPFMQRLTLLE